MQTWIRPHLNGDESAGYIPWDTSETWESDPADGIVGSSAAIRELLELVQRVGPTTSTVLIHGETGTGKELVARAIHRHGSRAARPFVAINCAAITESLLESELFGHTKGAFTGATAQKKGKIESAEGGTLFLDEISELAPGMQAKLLRVLQEREIEPVGGTHSIKVDVRILAATNRDLEDEVRAGRFREDLYFRLNVLSIATPPLRDRREDLPVLAKSFVLKVSKKYNVPPRALSPQAQALLMVYDWPGNVRELENAMERAVVLGDADEIVPEDLPRCIWEGAAIASETGYHGAIKHSKRQLIVRALGQANGHYIEAARILGLHPNSLLRLIRNLGLKTATRELPAG